MSHHRVEFAGVEFAYPDGTQALHGVSFIVGHGESVAIVGANGSGKSTLLAHLTGLLRPTSGSVSIGDVPVTRETLPDVRRSVGMVFQDPDDQLFMPTVAEDVAFGPVNMGLPPDRVEQRVVDALSRVAALELRDRAPHRLSAGEKRAVAIATVLAMSPSLLVLDEPTSNLDPRARRRLIELLAGFEHTKLVATHDLDMALELCERTIVLSGGRLTADGPTREIFSDADLLGRSGLERPLSMRGCPLCGSAPAE
jgi:cobalt/nickel transport system ATP-binding protein